MTLSQLAQQLYDVLVSAYALTPEEATECVRTAEFSSLKDVSIRLPLPKPGTVLLEVTCEHAFC